MENIEAVRMKSIALQQNIISGEHYRITMLTEGLVRLEYSQNGEFEDRPTQVVLHRDFPKTDYQVYKTEDGIEIKTTRLHISYDEKCFSENGLKIQVVGNLSAYHSLWHYGQKINDLGGTARTLDEADGAIPLESGIISKFGFAVLDDSNSFTMQEDGWVCPRNNENQDIYFWGYGHDYKEALKDFYYLCGKTPMLPRYALGNWWSRYYKYTEKSYLELMNRFKSENIPFTVAVIDMDWHKVDIDPKYGSGWTGYSWNKDFFPDPKRFLNTLHENGMHVSLNVHPAEGVRAFEDDYLEMAKALGMDPKEEKAIPFDAGNPQFIQAYLKYLHHPKEEEGVDFWWIDWQQGTSSKIVGLDPLWILNHYHYLDNQRKGKRPMIFSRYSGPGSHRYPIGFSGDTIISWESLQFQPFFTANASNIGYGWWSHDIGGHMKGYKDDELEVRWYQFGIFSPIMRLHSSCSEFNGKEPWRFKLEAEHAMGNALRERHRFIPYLYTMNYRNYKESIPLMLPLYYEHPEDSYPVGNPAYSHGNEYFFGSELLVAPVTSPRISGINLAKVEVWLPEGKWYDIYTGMMYKGGRTMNMYRSLESIPVLAKAGAILPLTEEIATNDAIKNPGSLRVQVYAGANGTFTLYEDDNETCLYEQGDCVLTEMTYEEDAVCKFRIMPAKGNCSLIPNTRNYVIAMTGFAELQPEQVNVMLNQKAIPYSLNYDTNKMEINIAVSDIPTDSELMISIDHKYVLSKNNVNARMFDMLNKAEISFELKERIYKILETNKDVVNMIGALYSIEMDPELFGVLTELVTAI